MNEPNWHDIPALREVTLERKRYCVSMRAESRVFQDEIMRRMEYQLAMDIFAVEHPEKTYRYPLDWWQHVKQRFAPRWFLKRWPVIERVVRVSFSECYPEFKPSLPGKLSVVKVLVSEWNGGEK